MSVVRRAYMLLLQVETRRSCSCEASRYFRDGNRERSLRRVSEGVSVSQAALGQQFARLLVVVVPAFILEFDVLKRRAGVCSFTAPLTLSASNAGPSACSDGSTATCLLTLGSKSTNSQPRHSKTAIADSAFVSDLSSVCAVWTGSLPLGSSKVADDSR